MTEDRGIEKLEKNASGGQGVLFRQRCQVQDTSAGGVIKNNIFSNKVTSNRSPMPWGPLDPTKLFIK
jgi:hypothetical protein